MEEWSKEIETNERSNEMSPKIKLEMQETCSTCDELRQGNEFFSSKCKIYERQIESLGKINAENGSFLRESQQQIAKLNQAVALLTQQIAEKITENTMLRLGIDVNKGGQVKENNCQVGGNNLPDIDKFLEIKMHIPSEDNLRKKETNNSQNSGDVQVFQEAEYQETEATMDKEQTCAWIVRDGKGKSGPCGRVFRVVEDLVDHFKKDHLKGDVQGRYVCSWDRCQRNGEPFKSKTAIVSHFRIHSGEKLFRCGCEGCDRTFADLGTLRMHRDDTHSRMRNLLRTEPPYNVSYW